MIDNEVALARLDQLLRRKKRIKLQVLTDGSVLPLAKLSNVEEAMASVRSIIGGDSACKVSPHETFVMAYNKDGKALKLDVNILASRLTAEEVLGNVIIADLPKKA